MGNLNKLVKVHQNKNISNFHIISADRYIYKFHPNIYIITMTFKLNNVKIVTFHFFREISQDIKYDFNTRDTF